MNIAKDFSDKGFIIVDDLWPLSALKCYEDVVEKRADTILSFLDPDKDFSNFNVHEKLQYMENNDKELFCSFTDDIGTTIAGMSLATNENLANILAEITGKDSREFFFTMPSIAWNDGATTRLRLKWHQESSYLQVYKHNYSFWTPLFRDLTEEDGPMLVCVGSHKKGTYPFKAYRKKQGDIGQLEVADEIVNQFEVFTCALKRNQAILFDQHLIHCTGQNHTKTPRASLIIRYFDTTNQKDINTPLKFKNPKPPTRYMKQGEVSIIDKQWAKQNDPLMSFAEVDE